LKDFGEEFQELEPQGPNKKTILQEFLSKKTVEAIYFYQNQMKVDYESRLF